MIQRIDWPPNYRCSAPSREPTVRYAVAHTVKDETVVSHARFGARALVVIALLLVPAISGVAAALDCESARTILPAAAVRQDSPLASGGRYERISVLGREYQCWSASDVHGAIVRACAETQ